MSDINRDKLYSAGSDDWGDDGTEYEVEPPDPEVLAAEERRAEEIIAASELAVDLHDIYDESEGRGDREYLDELVRGLRFRFTTKHLLVATTIVAIVIGISVQSDFGVVFVLGMLLAIGGVTAFLSWKQHERDVLIERRRRALFAKRRTAQKAAREQKTGLPPVEEPPAEEPDTDELDTTPAEPEKFRLRFTLAEMMTVAICTAVLIGLIAVLGLPQTTTLFGFAALGGLVLHALGFEPPYSVVFGWWVLLLLYVVLSIITAIWSGF
jgi:hypothetical protein